MKKKVIIVAVATIPLVTIIGGLYFADTMKKQNFVQEAIDSVDDAYYKDLARECANEDKSKYKCCLASVYDMSDLDARLATDSECVNMATDELKCIGSYEWCVPLANVTSPDMGGNENKCNIDSDCVQATCCHATDVVNEKFAPNCEEIMCTMSCDTVLDCGRGQPICKEGVCSVKVK